MKGKDKETSWEAPGISEREKVVAKGILDILKILLAEFADKLDKEYVREVENDFKCLDLSNWKNGVAIDKTGNTEKRTDMLEKVRRLVLDLLKFQ